jgi:hypothetical protein
MQAILHGVNTGALTGIRLTDRKMIPCNTCAAANFSLPPVPNLSEHRATQPLQLLSCDSFGPVSTTAIGGIRYIHYFYDSATKMIWEQGCKSKDENGEHFPGVIEHEQKLTGFHVDAVLMDSAGEYMSTELRRRLYMNRSR